MPDTEKPTHLRTLAILAVLSTCLYGTVALLSSRFDHHSSLAQRPIVPVLLLFAAAFAGYLYAVRIAIRARQDGKLISLIVLSAAVFRLVLLPSVPIQEIDIYRYLWDGAVSTAGVSPFRFSPQQVLASVDDPASRDLQKIAKLLADEPTLGEILNRVHHSELPTVYPPVSQLVFAAARLTTPAGASVHAQIVVMKIWLVACDLATLFLVIGLLRRCDRPVGLSVVYAWCPLVLKEIANTGHLDAIAVCLTTLAVYLAVGVLANKASTRGWQVVHATLVSVVLALAVGAKLYPVVLAPMMLFTLVRRLGWTHSVLPAAVFAVLTPLTIWPFIPGTQQPASVPAEQAGAVALPPPGAHSPQADPSRGVTTFLRRWEMNDFIFLLLVENLKPAAHVAANRVPWFSVAPEPMRVSIVDWVHQHLQIDREEVPFRTARVITAMAFIAIALKLGGRAASTVDLPSWLEAAFLTLAWFWLLCPTQNPWYWLWSLPLLPFARNRVWLAVSGLVFLYYLRFWFAYHWPGMPVWPTPYEGATFFDLVVTWIEFAPWLLCLLLSSAAAKGR